MLLSEEFSDQMYKKHQDLCNKLNLDAVVLHQSWLNFLDIKSSYTLEGDPLHWQGCAIFVACKQSTLQTVGHSTIEGNCVNLTSLLRHCNLSLAQFFNKIAKWVDMTKMSDELRQKIKRLEGSFAVSYHVFKKYIPIFSEIFQGPVETELLKQSRNRKQSIARTPPCTPTKVFEFCWILFSTVKGEIPSCSEDIVDSYHLLQACCDLAFRNAFLEDRRDLLNPNFPELPPNWSEPNYTIPTHAPCIIEYLCKYHNGISTEAKYVKEYSWKNHIKGLFAKDVLSGNEDNFTKLFHPEHFELNLKNITKAYEEHLLNKGDLDERIFLGEIVLGDSPLGLGLLDMPGATRNSELDSSSPLTHKQATRLQALLVGRQATPSETLIQIFHSCSRDPTEMIKQVVETLSELFCREFALQIPNVPMFSAQQSNQKVHLATVLFYRFVENIFLRERLQRRDISNLAQQDVFYQCMFACCLEIIMYCHNCQRKFPWILSALNLQPFYFVRVIELIVRLQDQLPREAVKHLNMVEQKIVESLIWKTESPIWNALKKGEESFPKYEEIALPGKTMTHDEQNTENYVISNNDLLSPGPSAVDRFQSPVVTPNNEMKRSQVFKTLQGSKIVLVDKDSLKQFLPSSDRSESEQPQLVLLPTFASNRPKKTGSLFIILRKFYNLAYARMEHLCNLLDINDVKLRQKIFTVFEYSVREHTDLLRDRHLDQLLMCAVYVVCKVTNAKERKFAEIMEYYRAQPQAKSHVYRNVLIERASGRNESSNTDKQDSEAERRGDLISFYNTVYIQVMRNFALQFSPNSQQNSDIRLSPLPKLTNNNLVSPRFQITNNLFISSHDGSSNVFAKGKALEYHFSKSPSRDLEKINSAVNKTITGKRLLGDESETDPPNKRVNLKFQSLFEERRNHLGE